MIISFSIISYIIRYVVEGIWLLYCAMYLYCNNVVCDNILLNYLKWLWWCVLGILVKGIWCCIVQGAGCGYDDIVNGILSWSIGYMHCVIYLLWSRGGGMECHVFLWGFTLPP